jgi:hypothetical protein
MWPFRKKTDLERVEACAQYCEWFADQEELVVAGRQRELEHAKAKLEAARQSAKVAKSIVELYVELHGGD